MTLVNVQIGLWTQERIQMRPEASNQRNTDFGIAPLKNGLWTLGLGQIELWIQPCSEHWIPK